MLFYDANEEQIAELVHRIQLRVLPRRIRCKEFFTDFDKLRCGRCSVVNFHRAMDFIGVTLSEQEADALAHHFTDYGPQVVRPQVVNYAEFCRRIDEIFADDNRQEMMKSAMLSMSPTATVMATFTPQTMNPQEEERFQHVLHRVATLCKARGVALKPLYTDLDRGLRPNPSRPNPRRGGKVTRAQFLRHWPFKKEMSPADLELLCERYATKEGAIHFMALHNEVSEVMPEAPQPFPVSTLHLKPDGAHWSHAELPPVQKIAAKVVEKRCRLLEHFRDYDPLRKGFCSPGQVKTVFTIMGLSKEIDRVEFETVLMLYMRPEDGLFSYERFCADVNSVSAPPHLENDPLLRLEMPDATTTQPARRNTMKVSDQRQAKVRLIEEKLRAFVRKRRLEMKPFFFDFDRARRGYVSRNQFQRIMSMMQYDLLEKDMALLCCTYCDFGNHSDFNYMKFIKSIDPPSGDVQDAMVQMGSACIPRRPISYFDERGRVIRKSSSTPVL